MCKCIIPNLIKMDQLTWAPLHFDQWTLQTSSFQNTFFPTLHKIVTNILHYWNNKHEFPKVNIKCYKIVIILCKKPLSTVLIRLQITSDTCTDTILLIINKERKFFTQFEVIAYCVKKSETWLGPTITNKEKTVYF